jgi:hypothetical protein
MSVVTPGECRDRGIPLPADDLVAQDIIDEQEAWLARRIGLLVGDRTETFRVGLGGTSAKLALARPADSVTVVDGAVTLDADRTRLVDHGASLILADVEVSPWWNGPYVSVTYEPSDELEVRKAIFDLVGLSATPLEKHKSEQVGAYSFSGGGAQGLAAARGVIVSSLLPKRDPLASLTAVSRRLRAGDPVINRAEPWD